MSWWNIWAPASTRILQKYNASVFQLTDNFLGIAYKYEEEFDQGHVPGIMNTTPQVTAQVVAFCTEPRSAKAIMTALGLKHWKTFQANYLNHFERENKSVPYS